MTPLALAAYSGKVDSIRALVELRANVNTKDNVRASAIALPMASLVAESLTA